MPGVGSADPKESESGQGAVKCEGERNGPCALCGRRRRGGVNRPRRSDRGVGAGSPCRGNADDEDRYEELLDGLARASSQPAGIFGTHWPKWRGATLRVTLCDEPPFTAPLETADIARKARPVVLDGAGRPDGVCELPWPPESEVRVVRAP